MCAERIKVRALVCHFCGHKFEPEEVAAQLASQQRNAAKAAQRQFAVTAEFSNALGGYLYRVEKDGSVSAVCRGERVQFHDWESFWRACPSAGVMAAFIGMSAEVRARYGCVAN
jgi:rubredoxin